MLSSWLQLIFGLLLILVAAQIFSNALEYLGQKLGISSGVTGSVFAAIATALPETLIPILAITVGTANHLANEEISVGAILGAPLMLSTLSICIMALSVIKKRGWLGKIVPEKTGFVRDLNFFLLAFLFAAIAMYLPHNPKIWRIGISIVLCGIYLVYLICTFRASKALVADGHGVITNEPLFLAKLKFKNNLTTTLLQLALGLILLLTSAKMFINGLAKVATNFGFSALILSLLIIPIATELPEKVNSVLWLRKNKDTLGFGNITGAMVFQGTLLPAIGIMLTPWQPNKAVLIGILVTLLAATWLRFNAAKQGIKIIMLLVNGLFYLTYLYIIL
jgi:cation:H+ antiporter